MRCLYCHNPDTWEIGIGTEVTADEIIAQYNKNKAFYKSGGITVTGGEPLLQIDFVTELFKKAKEYDIHTCIDTSGITYRETEEYLGKLDLLIRYTDLVMLDIKHIDSAKHKQLTGHDNNSILCFAKYLEKKNIPLWIRHIIVEGYTDSPDDLTQLGRFIGKLKNLKALDVLPYHTLGVSKYEQLGIDYPLKGISPLSTEDAVKAKSFILKGIKEVRQ